MKNNETANLALPAVTARQFREVMGQFATGVTIVTTETDGQAHGMTASAFLSGSLTPPLCVISVGRDARLFGLLEIGQRFAVSVLAHDQMPLAAHFAGRPDPDLTAPFIRVANTPAINHAAAHMVAEVEAVHTLGDHSLFVGRLLFMDCEEARAPLVHHAGRFGSLVHRQSDSGERAPEFW